MSEFINQNRSCRGTSLRCIFLKLYLINLSSLTQSCALMHWLKVSYRENGCSAWLHLRLFLITQAFLVFTIIEMSSTYEYCSSDCHDIRSWLWVPSADFCKVTLSHVTFLCEALVLLLVLFMEVVHSSLRQGVKGKLYFPRMLAPYHDILYHVLTLPTGCNNHCLVFNHCFSCLATAFQMAFVLCVQHMHTQIPHLCLQQKISVWASNRLSVIIVCMHEIKFLKNWP